MSSKATNQAINEGIGIDLGLKDFAILSNADVYKNINKTAKVKKLKHEQRKLSRKYESLKIQDKNLKGEVTRQNINIIIFDHILSSSLINMTDALINWFTNTLSFMPKELIAFIISMVPILELRGGLVAASLLGIGMCKAIGICFLGNLIPIPFILFFITPIFNWMKKTKLFRPIVEKLEAKSMSKSDKIKKYEFLGLVLFVGIPLPGTGAWTGALIASLLGIKFKKAFPAILTGLVLATTIMCIISYGIPWILGVLA